MIDPSSINRVQSTDLYKQLKKTQNQQKTNDSVKTDSSLFKSENLEKSNQIKQLLNEIHQTPEVREKLVQHFQELIQSDGYKTDANKIINKILGL